MLSLALLLAAPFVLAASAQSSSSASGSASMSGSSSAAAATTLNLFLDSEADQGFAGSIVEADACKTTIALYCTGGDYLAFGQQYYSCDGQDAATATFYGSTGYEISTAVETQTLGTDADVKLSESCSLEPSSRAVCEALVSASVEDAGKTKTKDTLTYDGAAATDKWFQVPITGGADKLPAATATCTADGNAAAATGLPGLYKVVIVPGAAALLAGAAAL